MKISYDPKKNARNIAARGLSFDVAQAFEWEFAIIWQDRRRVTVKSALLRWVGLDSGCIHWFLRIAQRLLISSA